MSMARELRVTIQAWQEFLREHDWQKLIDGVTPKQTGCGPVYELPNYLERPGESFAIADMRELQVAEPHYHSDGDVEIYLVIQGTALVVVGTEEREVGPGDAVIIPTEHAHFTIPRKDFVIAVINIPAFVSEHVITIPTDADNPSVHFDAEQLKRLTS